MQKVRDWFTGLFELTEEQKFYREWEYQRRNAVSKSDLQEIDAIFARGMKS